MEENMEMEIVKDEDINEDITYEEPCCETEKTCGILPLVGVALLLGVGAVGTFIYKNKEKLEERRTAKRIEKLQKKGYTVSKICVIDDSDSEENED